MTDLAWRLFRDGYDAVDRERSSRGGADDFETRLLGRRAVVVRSREGARAFYDEALVSRKGAVPPPLAWLLFGRGAVHGLDAPEHRERKAMFLDVLAPERLGSLAHLVDASVRRQAATWSGREVEVYDELVVAYGRAVLEWAGIPLDEEEATARSRQLAQIVDGFGFAGTAYLRAWRARVEADRWAGRLVEQVRSGQLSAPAGSALDEIARSDLAPRVAGVELLNVVRPTVAVAWLGTFAALRFAEHTDWRARLVDAEADRDRLSFSQEVRRSTPFVPVLAGRARTRAVVGGIALRPGDRVVLDVHGIDHDTSRWAEPETFLPGRFRQSGAGPFDLVPQGGGDPATGHRCPGESVALLLIDLTLRALALVEYEVCDDVVDRTRMPTLPRDGLRVRVRPATETART